MMEPEKSIRGQDGSQEKKEVLYYQHKEIAGGGLFACAYACVCARAHVCTCMCSFMCDCMYGQMEGGPASSASSQDLCAQMPSRVGPRRCRHPGTGVSESSRGMSSCF